MSTWLNANVVMSNKEKTIFQYILPSQDGPLYSPNQNINHPHSKSSKNYYCNFIISWISPLLAPQRNYFSPSDASDVYHSEKCTAENFQIERNVMCNIVLKLSYQKECDRSDSILFDYEPNGIPFDSWLRQKRQSHSFQFETNHLFTHSDKYIAEYFQI